MVVETICDQHAAVRQERHVLWLRKVRAIVPGDVLLAQRLQQLFAVVRKHVDRVERFIDHPHALLAIVRADADAVRARACRAFAEMVPLRPSLLHAAMAIQRVEAVLPHAAIGQREHVHLQRSGEARVFRRQRIGQAELTALRDEDTIRRFREHAGVATEGKPRRRERLMPAAHDRVWAGPDRTFGHQGLRASGGHRRCVL